MAAGDAAVAEATCDGSCCCFCCCCWLPDARAGWWALVTLVEAGERRGAAEGAAPSAEGRGTAEAGAMAAVAVAGDEAGDEEEEEATVVEEETGAEALWTEQR